MVKKKAYICLVISLGGLIFVVSLLFVFAKNADITPAELQGQTPQSSSTNDVDSQMDPPTSGYTLRSSEPESLSPRFRQLADELSKAYRPGRISARIRIQNELAELWRSEPPSVKDLLAEIGNADAPEVYRVYFAKVLRNQIKRRAYDDAERSAAISELQGVISSQSEPEQFRSELSMLLTTVDQSDATISTVLPLMNSSDDETAARAVAALCNTTSPMAIEGLYDFVQGHEKFQKTKPNALATALAPLSAVPEYDVVPIIQGIVSTTDDINLLRTSIQCLGRVPPSKAVLEVIVTAHDSASKISGQAPYLEYLSRAALGAHADYIKENQQTIETSLLDKIQKIRGTK